MKKKIVNTVLLAVLVVPTANAQRSYKGKSLDYILGKIGDKTYKSPNCTKSPRGKCIPYRSQMKSAGWFASDVEKKEVELHNIRVRNQWFLENIESFPTPTEIKMEDLKKQLQRSVASHDRVVEEFNEVRLSENEAAQSLNELEAKRAKLQAKQEALKKESLSIMGSDDYEDKAERVEDILEELEDLASEAGDAEKELLTIQSQYDGKADEFEASAREIMRTQMEIGKTRSILNKQDKTKLSPKARESLESVLTAAERRLQEAKEDMVKDSFAKLIREKGAADTLLSDFGKLKKDLELDKSQGDLMFKLMKDKYEKSALNKLVQAQIESTVTNKCPAIDACMKGTVNELSTDVDSIRNASDPSQAPGTGKK